MEDLGNPELIDQIRKEISERGMIPFAEFMERSLFTPGLGYYTSPGEKIGRGGDYYTSTDVHPLFGAMMARQLAQIGKLLPGSPLYVVEIGAGTGSLGQGILEGLRSDDPEAYERLSYLIVERSERMIERQKSLLGTYEPEGKIRWVEGLHDSLFSGGLTGIILSNELLDSFPVHRMIQTGGRLQEVYVTVQEGRFAEILAEPSRPELTAYFDRLGVTLREGQQAEVNLRALDWMREVGRALRKGVVITIDYGYPAAELYSAQRMRGTYLCYYRHRVSENPYIRVGEQDMTAHVDFTSLARVGQEVGLTVTGWTNQHYFLVSLGMAQEMEQRLARHQDPGERERELRAMAGLLAPGGMGSVFKVLVQHKGLKDPTLQGLSFKPYPAEALFSL